MEIWGLNSSRATALALLVSLLGARAHACNEAYFTYSLTPPSASKLDPKEFRTLRMGPASGAMLPAGTALSILADTNCLAKNGPRFWSRGSREIVSGSPLRSIRYELTSASDLASLSRAFEQDECVRLVSPDHPVHVEASTDPYASRQGHLKSLGFSRAWPKFLLPVLTRPKVTIAVIDTGIDLTHPDLSWNRWVNPNEIANGRDDDGDGYEDDLDGFNFAENKSASGPIGRFPDRHHGTHVAGLAASRWDNGEGGTGVNGIAKLMSLNVFTGDGASSTAIIENALRYAADHGADVINISLGTSDPSRSMRVALEYAVSKGSLVVVAAGNSGKELCGEPFDSGFNSPASYSAIEGVITVGSYDAATGLPSFFSNYSASLVELAAPGSQLSSRRPMTGLLSTVPGGRYAELSGTSMASPVVAGAASLAVAWLKAYGYESTPSRLERILTESAVTDPEFFGRVRDSRRLDLRALASYLERNYPERF